MIDAVFFDKLVSTYSPACRLASRLVLYYRKPSHDEFETKIGLLGGYR